MKRIVPTTKRKSPGVKELEELKAKYPKKEKEKKKEVKTKKTSTKKKEENKSGRILNHRQLMFCEEYIITNNATQSYMKVYNPKNESTARTNACKLLTNTNIKNYIEERLTKVEKSKIADADELLEFITSVIRGEVKDQLGFETSVKDRLTATKMLAERYSLFKSQEEEEKEKREMPEMKITIVDNSDLEQALYDADK